MNKKFLLTILTLSAFLLADNHMGKNDISNKMWAKMKMDLAELKGPPSVSEVEANKSAKLADLDLLIDSGNYEGRVLQRLKMMREKIANTETPSQEQINQRHQRKLRMMKMKMRSKVRMMDRKFRNPKRDREMRERERWEARKYKKRPN